ncbi:MAG: Gx transporter family protein [Clostridia bacterium]|nr:Gx transporter family protein [Clostridia bacterium]
MRNANRKKIYDLAFLSLLTSVALILSYVETVLPPVFSAVSGIKLGFPNILIIYILYRMDITRAALVSFIRILVVSLLFGTVLSFVYSLAGAVLSLAVMAIMKKTDLFSTVGVSVAGGITHNLGQVLVAILLLRTAEIGYYMIVLSVTGILAGLFVGLCGALLIKRLNFYEKQI